MKRKLIFGMAGVVALGLASQVMATEITIADNVPGTGFGGGPYGVAREDNETEPGTINSQVWDLEAFAIVGKTLYMVGGYNFSGGQLSGGYTYKPGDLFIKIGGSEPSGAPTTPGYGQIANGTGAGTMYGYSYAVVLGGGLPASGSATVETLNAASMLNTVIYDQFVSNPWNYASGASSSGSTAITYTTGLNDNAALFASLGLPTLNGGAGSHNVVSVDLSFLGAVAANTPVWFSYTMECGNDSMKGEYTGGFRIPDGGATLVLLGMGLSALGVAGRKLRRV